jgi:sterol desaturase/sphingolipid hydroxylase (fatty acid hydroxylase superfamily)
VIRKDIDSLEGTCQRCLQTKPRQDLDRLLWCDACVTRAQALAVSQSWYVGLAVAVVLALWIWLYIQPSNLVIGGWIGTVVGAFYVIARVVRELLYAAARVSSGPAGEAVPPE